MRILLASSSSGSRGGGELFLVYLGRALAQRGHEVTLWASTHPRMDELSNTFIGFGEVIRSKYANTYDRRGRSLASYANLWGSRVVAAEWRKLGSQVVHVNKQNLEDGLDLLRAARCSRIPSLATIHLTQTAEYLNARFAAVRDWIARKALCSYPGMLVAVLENRWKDLLNFLGPSPRIRMVQNGVPLFDLTQRESARASKRAELGYANHHQLFLGLGRMVKQKRPLVFLEQAERIHLKMPNARFLWVGEGPISEEWDSWVASRGLQEVIHRLTWQHDIQPLLFAADVFMHTAEYEGLPLAILEGMSAGLPVALTSNLITDLPFLAPAEPILLNGGIDFGTLENRVEMRARGQAARGIVKDRFSFDRMAEEYEVLYKTLASSSAHR